MEPLRNRVALALCLNQGKVSDADNPSDDGFDVGLYVRMSNDIVWTIVLLF